jgi:hypothetical protein
MNAKVATVIDDMRAAFYLIVASYCISIGLDADQTEEAWTRLGASLLPHDVRDAYGQLSAIGLFYTAADRSENVGNPNKEGVS